MICGIFAAFLVSELEPGQRILLPPKAPGLMGEAREVLSVGISGGTVVLHVEGLRPMWAHAKQLVQVEVER